MRFLAVAGLASACLAASPLYAADLFETAPPPMDVPGAQSELGSNWYIRGDVGYGQTKQATVVPTAGLFPSIGNQPIGNPTDPVAVTRGDDTTTWSGDLGLGFGYRINDFFRVEADWQFSKGPGLAVQQDVFCPEVATAVSNYNYTNPVSTTNNGVTTTTYTQTAVPVGYQYDYTTCKGNLNVTQYNNTGLVMGYVDLGHYWLFTPYVGAGAGLNVNTLAGSLNFFQNDTGAVYSGPTVSGSAPGLWVTPTGQQDIEGYTIYGPLPKTPPISGTPQPIGPANWYRRIDTTKYTFAGSLAAGLGMKISQSATLDAAYHVTSLDLFGGTKGLRQSFTLGVRYDLN